MKPNTFLIVFFLLTPLIGCVKTSKHLNGLELGMTKAQVVAIMGTPHSVSAQGSCEYLAYNLDVHSMGGKAEYFVKLIDSHVDSYGRKGDFDSTKEATLNLKIKK